MDGLAVFDYDDGGESEYHAPSIGRQKVVRPRNWSAEVELALDTTYERFNAKSVLTLASKGKMPCV